MTATVSCCEPLLSKTAHLNKSTWRIVRAAKNAASKHAEDFSKGSRWFSGNRVGIDKNKQDPPKDVAVYSGQVSGSKLSERSLKMSRCLGRTSHGTKRRVFTALWRHGRPAASAPPTVPGLCPGFLKGHCKTDQRGQNEVGTRRGAGGRFLFSWDVVGKSSKTTPLVEQNFP